jgi:nucleotide-binding universal stress UspA family protein
MSDDRALRDALEQAQAWAKSLADQLADERAERESLEDELLTVREALEQAEKVPLPPPGSNHELLRLKAQVHAQQLQLTQLQAERDRLSQELAVLAQKPGARERLQQFEELNRLRNRVAALERERFSEEP